jgi:CzcA family heavy metal efflux pump
MPPVSVTGRLMKIGLSSQTIPLTDMSMISYWTIRARLLRVPGVANVVIWGERIKMPQVRVDPERMRAHDVSLDEVMEVTADALDVGILQYSKGALIGTGGFMDTPNQRIGTRLVSPIVTPRDLARVPIGKRVKPNGDALILSDVADVVEDTWPLFGDAVINGGPGLMLVVFKYPWANTLDATHGVEAALNELKPGLPGLEIDTTIFRPADFIQLAFDNLTRALLLGCLLVMLVLGAFLFEWRTALISLVAIPLSLTAGALVLFAQGVTLNTMILAGFVIAIGVVVDDAIIDVENIIRRLRLNRAAEHPHSAIKVVLDASMEVRSAVLYGSLIVIVVFLPVFMLEGLAGAFFRPLALSYVLAIIASLVVALTITPALALVLLPRHLDRHESRLVGGLKTRYRGVLAAIVDRPKAALASLTLMLAVTAATVPLLGEEFLPNFREYDFLMHWVEKPGTSLDAMRRVTVSASKELMAIPGVRNFGSHIGRAEVADEVVGPNFTELWISLDPSVDYEETVAKIQSVVDGYPGLVRDLLTYLRERIKEVLTGASASIVVRVYGPDLGGLREHASAVAAAIAETSGVVDLKVEPQVLVPQIDVRFDADRAALLGVPPAAAREAVATLVRGAKVGEVRRDQMSFDVFVWGEARARGDLEALRRLPIEAPAGGLVPLSAVADVEIVAAPNEIKRERSSRRIDVTCNVRGRDLGRVAREIETRLKQVPFAAGYHPEILGEYQAREAARTRLLALSGLAALGIFLLHADLGSLRLAGLVFGSLPFALVGGVLAAVLAGGVLSLGSLVGFVSVLGIAARNGILLVSHYRHLERVEGVPFGPELILRGAEERLVPILMTALCAGLALVPLALAGDAPGYEIEQPMAVVILGGLVTSTALNLLLLPALYARFGRGAGRILSR